jgi:two-component system NtrC family sensor kinase
MKSSPKNAGRKAGWSSAEMQLPGAVSERPLRTLFFASLIFPLVIFGIASAVTYRQHLDDAIDRLERTLGHVHEHAVKVFESLDVASIYVDEVIGGVSTEEISANEQRYHDRLKRVVERLPELRDLWVVDAHGRPVVSATIFPVNRDINVSDRTFFSSIKDRKSDSLISEVLQSRVANRSVAIIARRRAPPGGDPNGFDGITTVALAPEYFSNYYASIPGNASDSTIGLLRKDGVVIAWYPPGRAAKLNPSSALALAIAGNDSGRVTSISPVDHVERIFVFRRLPGNDIYVLAGIDKSSIVAGWMQAISYHLIFGIPASFGLAFLSWLALRRARREALAYTQLQEEVARREVTEQALRQSQKMEAVGRLTGGIAHDFNNLLTAIMGNADLALRRTSSEEERVTRPMKAIKEASVRAAALVQRLLAFSRQHPHEVRTLDINQLVRDMSDLLLRTIGESVTIETVLAAGLWNATLDTNELENAVLNLAINARDAMPGGGKLTIETANTYLDEDYARKEADGLEPGQYVLLAVSDAGAGMSRDVIDQAFEPFFTTKPKGVGSGLGLSMVYGFVKQSNGHIKIYSEIGEGTTIKMYFPRGPDQRNDPQAISKTERRKAAPVSIGNETILLVEDDDTVNKFGVEVLTELGYRVISARDGNEALAQLDKHPDIQMLFTDVILPGGLNGRQLANEVERRRHKIKVLFATGYTRNAIIHHGRLDPGVDVLLKPFTYEALAEKVRAVLDGDKA